MKNTALNVGEIEIIYHKPVVRSGSFNNTTIEGLFSTSYCINNWVGRRTV